MFLKDKNSAQKRFNVCKSCVYLSQHGFCEKCGCFMKAKVKLANANCPIGKW